MDAPALATLRRGVAVLGADRPGLVDALLAYLDLLERWNRRYNLTGTREPTLLVTRHVLDSLAVAPFIDADPVLDLGSGAGLPGVVLALALPARRFVLLDSRLKKTRFLEQARIELDLDNVEVVRARAEDYAPPAPFPVIVARAVADLAGLLAMSRHLLAAGGALLAMKARRGDDERAGLLAAGVPATMQPLRVPGLEAGRTLIIVRPDVRSPASDGVQ
ncbi:MAG: 16S rRNA (guanine(527)-N(7))-methyltransferase RsmG [Gammaproteobacteria bacterium]|nr:16S rRNA (guanine(527)-N(7))-methyltransferase RsmG [Gammaproteobacteria bacterium]